MFVANLKLVTRISSVNVMFDERERAWAGDEVRMLAYLKGLLIHMCQGSVSGLVGCPC